ncbi:RidA family protein [Chloroflexota bacterium]
MELKTYKLYYGGKLMRWGKGTVVKGGKGLIFLGGAEGRSPVDDSVVPGAEAQTRMCFEKIKANLEEMGSSLDHLIKLVFYVVHDPAYELAKSPTWQAAIKARNEFFREYAPQLCDDANPPTLDLVGVAALARKEMLIEIAAYAVIPD